MDFRALRLTKEVRKYDRDLYAERNGSGMIQIRRRTTIWDTYEVDGSTLKVSHPSFQVILCLTDNWNVNGRPVERGIEQVIDQLKSMDLWRDDQVYSQLVKKRETQEELKERALKNERRARAYDIRKDFAKATNEFNTASM